MKIRIKQFDNSLPVPSYEKKAAGFDLYCRLGATIKPHQMKAIPANIAVEIPEGYALLIIPRSSTAARKGLIMPHSFGLIDPFYNGDENEVVLFFYNISDTTATVKKGDKLAQGLLIKTERADFSAVKKLNKTKRPQWGVEKKLKLLAK